MYENLTVRMRPAAIALKECHLDLRNDVRQIIGASMSEPHTTLVCSIVIFHDVIYIYILSVVRRSVNRGDTLLT